MSNREWISRRGSGSIGRRGGFGSRRRVDSRDWFGGWKIRLPHSGRGLCARGDVSGGGRASSRGWSACGAGRADGCWREVRWPIGRVVRRGWRNAGGRGRANSPRIPTRGRMGVLIWRRGCRGRKLLDQPFKPGPHGIVDQTVIKPSPHRQQLSAAALHHSPIHPCAHPCSLAAGVREGIEAPPWLEGMPAGGSYRISSQFPSGSCR